MAYPLISDDLANEIEKFAKWPSMCLEAEDARALLADFGERTATTSRMVAVCAEELVEGEITKLVWKECPSLRLVALTESGCVLRDTLEEFLPASLRPRAVADRWLIYLHALWRNAEKSGDVPEAVVSEAITLAACAVGARNELFRRWWVHVGVDAAVWNLLLGWQWDAPPEAGELRMPERLSRLISARIREDASDVQGEAWQLLAKRYGHRHPVDVLVAALDGSLNIVPQAIAEESQRERRRGLRRRSASWVVEFRPELDAIDYENAERIALRIEKDQRDAAVLAAAHSADPALLDELWRGAEEAGKPKMVDKKGVAERLGVTTQTVQNRIKRVRAIVAGAAPRLPVRKSRPSES